MVLSPEEQEAIRQAVYADMIEIEDLIMRRAGSYRYLCRLQGNPTFTHTPCGPVLRYLPPLAMRQAP
jgi:hypothetical protein